MSDQHKDIILYVTDTTKREELENLEGKTFQVHVLSENKALYDRIRLIPVEIIPADVVDTQCIVDTRCPVIIKGERCGKSVGHPGKHMWANGD